MIFKGTRISPKGLFRLIGVVLRKAKGFHQAAKVGIQTIATIG